MSVLHYSLLFGGLSRFLLSIPPSFLSFDEGCIFSFFVGWERVSRRKVEVGVLVPLFYFLILLFVFIFVF